MSKNLRTGWIVLSMALGVLAADTHAIAQRIVIGGGNARSRERNNDNDDDDEEETRDENRSDSNNSRSGSSRSRSRTQEQINQFFGQGGQGGQSGQPGQPGQGGRNGQSGQPGQSGFNGQGGRGGQGGGRDDYRSGDFNQGRPGGNSGQLQLFRPGNVNQGSRFGNWQGDRWQGSRDVQQWSQVFSNNRQPFSKDWYRDHPKAWKYDNDKANVWVTASLPGVYGWLNWGRVPAQYNVGIVNPAAVDYSRFHDFYPLGVYSLMSGQGDMGTRIVQLAIDRHGHIAGNYYDMIADANYSISGDVSRQSQRVSWWLNKNEAIRFRVSLHRLLQPYGYVTVQMPGGEQDWQFVRLEN